MSEKRVITVRVDGHGRIVAENVPEGWLVVPDAESEWTCGHKAGAVCAECHRLLIERANELNAQNYALRDKLTETLADANKLGRGIENLNKRIAHLEERDAALARQLAHFKALVDHLAGPGHEFG